MGYFSPFLNENLARGHAAELQAIAQRQQQVRAARTTMSPRAGRWKSSLGWALVSAGLGLLSQPPGRSRRRAPAPGTPGPQGPLTQLVTTTFCPCGCDG